MREKSSQLCWLCDKACGGCSWSKDFTPVPGWKAKPTKLVRYVEATRKKVYTDSYAIQECPEFEIAKEFKDRVVLCSECNYYRGNGCLNKAVIGKEIWLPRSEHDYCSKGERRVKNE